MPSPFGATVSGAFKNQTCVIMSPPYNGTKQMLWENGR